MADEKTNDFTAWMDGAPREPRPEAARDAKLWRELAEFSAQHPGVSVADAMRSVQRAAPDRRAF